MTVEDPISDFVARLKNANHRKHGELELPPSNLKLDVAEVLKKEGFIKDYSEEDGEEMKVVMKYEGDRRVIDDMERVSKPSRRVYVSKDDIPEVLGGLGIAVLSTSRGVMTGEEAHEKGVGGELLLKAW